MSETSPSPGERGWTAPATLLALLLAISAVASVIDVVPQMVGIDYYLYWVVGSAHRADGIGDVYAKSEEVRVGELYFERARQESAQQPKGAPPTRRFVAANVRRQLDNYSTPFLYSVYGSCVSGSYERDADRTNRASIALYFLGIVALCAALRYSPLGMLIAVAALSIWFTPFVSDSQVGNVNRVQLGFLGVFAWLASARRVPWHHVLAGFVIGVALMFKPNLAHVALVLGVGWIASRQMRKLVHVALGGVVGIVACTAMSWAYFGSLAPWWRWIQKLPGLMPTWATEDGVVSLARVLSDRLGIQVPGLLPPLFLAAIVALIAYVRFAKRQPVDASESDRERALADWDILLLALGAAASVLSTKLVWSHYYVLALPLVLYLLRPDARTRVPARIAAVVALALVSLEIALKLTGGRADTALCLVLGTTLLFALGFLDGLRCSGPQLAHASR